jgi:hypothetical protein
MPLFDLSGAVPRPFRRIQSNADVYEAEIETLFWGDLETFAGEALFAVARQARIPGGGIPDIVALDAAGRVVVVEIKRNVDRSQLSQCLEYAGWARRASLDDLASIYHAGPTAFFSDWQEFTSTDAPRVLNRVPRLILVARTFDGRTESALEYLADSGVPVKLISVVFYEDASGGRIMDVNNGADAILPVDLAAPPLERDRVGIERRTSTKAYMGITLTDLLEADLIEPNERIEWIRPQVGERHEGTIRGDGLVVTPGGRTFTSLSMAADGLAGGSHNGWEVWKVPRLGGVRMLDVRQQLMDSSE